MSAKEEEYRVPDYPSQEKGFILDEEKFGKFSSDIFKVPLFGIICAIYLNFYYIYSLKKPIQLATFIIGFFIQILSIEIILNMIFKPKKDE